MKGTFQRKYLGIPYALYLLVFVVMPLIVIVKYAFTDASGKPGIGNFINFFTDPNTIAGMFLTTECLIVDKPEKEPAMPMGGAPGMGGMM